MINGSLIYDPATMFATIWSGSNKVIHLVKDKCKNLRKIDFFF